MHRRTECPRREFRTRLIPKEWFEEEQKRITQRSSRSACVSIDPLLEPKRVGNDYLLSGLVFCGAVEGEEHPMRITSIPAKKGKRGLYIAYICSTMQNPRGTACHAKRVSLRALNQAVLDNLFMHVLTVETLGPLADAIAGKLIERSRTWVSALVESRRSWPAYARQSRTCWMGSSGLASCRSYVSGWRSVSGKKWPC